MATKENDVVGFACFSNGKANRYPFASKNDLICGPYYITPEFRRKGLATKMLDGIIEKYEFEYDSIFAHIWYTNEASILCMQKLGFVKKGMLSTKGILQKCKYDDNGNLVLVEKKR